MNESAHPIKGQLARIASLTGIDKAVAYSAGSRVVAAVSGVASIFFISLCLSEEQQGFYFTFGSIVALQVFFELGLTNIITQFVSHEYAHIKEGERGSEKNMSRLAHLLRFSVKWYAVASALYMIFILGAGFWFFNRYSPNADSSVWMIPWLLVTAISALNLFLSVILALLKGVDKVTEVSKIVFWQQLLMPLAIWTGLLCGLGLYVVGIGYSVSFLCACVLLWKEGLFKPLKDLWRVAVVEKVNYAKEIFPYQWRISLSWASGYFVFQLFNPVLFATSGPVAAGQMGMTLAALNGISAFASSWIDTKVPLLSNMIALKRFRELDRIFHRIGLQLTAICAMLLILFIAFVEIMDFAGLSLAKRFLPFWPLLFMSGAILANQVGNCWATYLRCHKREPLLVNSLVGAVSCGVSTIVLGKYFGAVGIAAGYFALRLILSAWNYLVYVDKKKEWHCSREEIEE